MTRLIRPARTETYEHTISGLLSKRREMLTVYWMMISLAAYRALADLAFRPFHWRKTTHTARKPRRTSQEES